MANNEFQGPAFEASLANITMNIGNFAKDKGAMAASARSLSRMAPNRSIVKMARDRVMQFPVLMSSDISTTDAVVIAKALEKQFSAVAMLVLAGKLSVNSASNQDISDVLRSIHNNDDAPKMMDYLVDVSGAAQSASGIVNSLAKESFVVEMDRDELEAMWYGTQECLNKDSLNDLYKPNEAAINKMDASLSGKFITENQFNKAMESDVASDVFGAIKKNVQDTSGNYIPQDDIRNIKNTVPAIVPNNQMSSMEPTMVNATVYVDGTYRSFLVGIKSMVRVVPSDFMVNQLIKSVQDNELAFKIIKWSKGETKFFRDFIFDLSTAREDAQDVKNGQGWFSALRRRKVASKAFLGSSTNTSPITSLVISTTEVERVKAATGVDLSKPVVAQKLMAENFLIAFMIYDPQTQVVDTIMDGDATDGGFYETTVKGLKATNGQENSLTTDDLAKLLGRRA